MSDPDLTELWELPDDMSPADRLSVESILRHAGGKKRTFRLTNIYEIRNTDVPALVEVSDE